QQFQVSALAGVVLRAVDPGERCNARAGRCLSADSARAFVEGAANARCRQPCTRTQTAPRRLASLEPGEDAAPRGRLGGALHRGSRCVVHVVLRDAPTDAATAPAKRRAAAG